MIQLRSRIKVTDNSGAKIIACFKVLNGKAQDRAQINDVIVASVKEAIPHTNVKKKDIVKAVIVRQRFPLRRKDGTTLKFDDNAAVLIDNDNNPRASRITGPVAREIKQKFSKIISLAPEVL